MKKILGVFNPPGGHWVGDGFPVRSLFSYDRQAAALSPFLLLDRAGPYDFSPTTQQRGVGEHPHRGFETVTLVYEGGVSHRDSGGGGGSIGPGDVQWMTAGSGVVHEEFHSPEFAGRGGRLDMVQLWVDLPKADKMTAPRYQTLRDADMPVQQLAPGASLRLVAGEYDRAKGPAQTFSPLLLADLTLEPGATASLQFAEGHTAALVGLEGAAELNNERQLTAAQWALFDREAGEVRLRNDAEQSARLLVLSGEPLNQPVVGRGPFVMTAAREINEAIRDFNAGRFGRLPVAEAP